MKTNELSIGERQAIFSRGKKKENSVRAVAHELAIPQDVIHLSALHRKPELSSHRKTNISCKCFPKWNAVKTKELLIQNIQVHWLSLVKVVSWLDLAWLLFQQVLTYLYY